MKRRALPFAVYGLIAIMLGGCMNFFGPSIRDLALVSVEVVPPRVIPSTGELRDDSPQLLVTLRTEADLVDIMQGGHFNDFNVFLLASICKNGDYDKTAEISIDRHIFWPGGDVTGDRTYYRDDYSVEKFRQMYPGFRNLRIKEYKIFLPIRHEPNSSHDPFPLSFDLEEHPEDVCLAVAGGAIVGVYYQSNTVIVPKNSILRAIQGGMKGGVN